jgi:hypothetical protein
MEENEPQIGMMVSETEERGRDEPSPTFPCIVRERMCRHTVEYNMKVLCFK